MVDIEYAREFIATKPHLILSMSWVSTWVRQLFFLSNGDQDVREFNNYFTQQDNENFATHVQRCIFFFYSYFLIDENICEVKTFTFENLKERFGDTPSIPLRDILASFNERDRHMFHALTIDVFLTVCSPLVGEELGIERTPAHDFMYTYLSRPPCDEKGTETKDVHGGDACTPIVS